jgi:UDP-N-acetylglucosamine 2-epimerase (non-hydrolysing)
MKIISIVGARPNFIKVAPLHRAFQQEAKITSKIVHTGQHYDAKMSDVFFEQLQLPQPDYFLGAGGGTHTQQVAQIMLAFEEIIEKEKPDVVLVVGDVNSTVAAAMVAKKTPGVLLAHNEAGLRSFDRGMPEEINRLITDSISDLYFVTEMAGMINLAKENVADEKIHFVGNVMIDSLVHYRETAAQCGAMEKLGLHPKQFFLMTMHRPSNVDYQEGLESILSIIRYIAERQTLVFPIHPRTLKNLQKYGLEADLRAIDNLILTEPLGYFEFLQLMDNATAIVTDSGGIQEETTYLQAPCLTFRDTTERPVTVELGSNELLADLNPVTANQKIQQILDGKWKKGIVPPLWDGKAAERIAKILANLK